MHAMLPRLVSTDFPALSRRKLEVLQVNLGYRCNQTCLHCHVNAGPTRTEMMTRENLDLVKLVLVRTKVPTLDLTGGAPELHEGFRELVMVARAFGVEVIDRCNLTILLEPGQEDLAEFLASFRVKVVASLPCYSIKNVDQQRGEGVFDKSIAALKRLNALGYGHSGSGLTLDLVYNPVGPTLPPNQDKLEARYREELGAHFGIVFNRLYTLVNMPIQRFGSTLVSRGEFHTYMQLLKDNYVPENLEQVMCRTTLSVDWHGFLYDCDFNQQLAIPVLGRPHLKQLLSQDPDDWPIQVANHCYGCTAGQGSSCGGALKS